MLWSKNKFSQLFFKEMYGAQCGEFVCDLGTWRVKGGKKGQEIFRGCLKLTNDVQDQVELKKIILNDRALWEEFRKN